MDILLDIIHNEIIVASFMAWLIAQVIKVVLVLLKERRWDLSRMFGSGGMPSSHSALVVAMATAVGRLEGFGSTFFAIAVALACMMLLMSVGQLVSRQNCSIASRKIFIGTSILTAKSSRNSWVIRL